MVDESGRAASPNRLSSATEPASGLGPSGFDPARRLEFRPDDRGEFDEIVARFADGMVHVETMSKTGCYVGFYWDDGRYCQWWIRSDKKLRYHHEDGDGEQPRFTAWGVDRLARDSDRNPEGEDPQGLRAKPESAGRQASPND